MLVVAWLAGRVAVTFSASLGWLGATLVDGGFLALVAAAAAREIIAGGNWSNLKIVTLIVLLAAGNIGFHLEAHFAGSADISIRVGLAAVIMLITLIGGRMCRASRATGWRARTPAACRPVRPLRCRRHRGKRRRTRGLDRCPERMGAGAALLVAGLLQTARLAGPENARRAAPRC